MKHQKSSEIPNAIHTLEILYDRLVIDHVDSGTIEYFVQGKTGANPPGNARCEDGLFYSEHFLAVFDGATDNSSRDYLGRKSGRVARDLIAGVFCALPPEASKEDVLDRINVAYQHFYAEFGELDFVANPHWRPTSTLIWYSFARRELVAIADSKARIDGIPYNTEGKLVDTLNSEMRVRVIRALNLSDSDVAQNDLGRLYITPLIERQFRYQNNSAAPEAFQYWAIDGFAIPPEKLLVWQFASTPDVIELSTDGYEFLPAESRIEAYEESLAQLLKDDPQRLTNPSTKGMQEANVSFDDRTVLIYRRTEAQDQ